MSGFVSLSIGTGGLAGAASAGYPAACPTFARSPSWSRARWDQTPATIDWSDGRLHDLAGVSFASS
jgi:hypothetical protein